MYAKRRTTNQDKIQAVFSLSHVATFSSIGINTQQDRDPDNSYVYTEYDCFVGSLHNTYILVCSEYLTSLILFTVVWDGVGCGKSAFFVAKAVAKTDALRAVGEAEQGQMIRGMPSSFRQL